MTSPRIAVVGTGALGRHHARILSAMPGVELTAVADVDPVAGREVAERCGTTWVADFRELLGRVDAAVVAVPTRAHFAVAGELLRHGIDVLVEKPITASLAEARQLAELAELSGSLLQVGHVERYNPALTAARPFLRAPAYIRAERYSAYSFRSTDIGVVHDVMIHDIDLVLSLVPAPIERVEAFGVSILGEHEDCVQARLFFAGGRLADQSASRVSPVARRAMQIWSAEGCACLDFAARETVVYQPSPTLRYGAAPLDRARQPGADLEQLRSEVFGTYVKTNRPAVSPCDQLTEELQAFAESVRTRGQPLVGGVEAVRAMAVADQILERVASQTWQIAGGQAVGPFLEAVEPLRKAG